MCSVVKPDDIPAAACKQPLDFGIDVRRQVVGGIDALRGHDEFALFGLVLVDLGMAGQAEPLANGQIAYRAFAMEALGDEFVVRHQRIADGQQVEPAVAKMRRRHLVLFQAGGQCIPRLALVDAQRRTGRGAAVAGIQVIPAVQRRMAGHQRALGAPERDRVALLGRAVAVKTDRAGCIVGQFPVIVEQHQRVADAGDIATCLTLPVGSARAEKPGDAAALHQAAHEAGIRFVQLHRERALRELAVEQTAVDIEVEGRRDHGIVSLPLFEDQFDDLELTLVAENARRARRVHHRQRVAHGQLVTRDPAIAVARCRRRDDSAQPAQVAPVGHDLQFARQTNKTLQFERRVFGQAQNLQLEAAAH